MNRRNNRAKVVYTDGCGREYYHDDLREDNRGRYIYDKYDKCKVYEDNNDNRGEDRRGRDKTSTGMSLQDIKDQLHGTESVTTQVVEEAYDYGKLSKFHLSIREGVIEKDLANGFREIVDLPSNLHIKLLYPIDTALRNPENTLKAFSEYIKGLIIAPGTKYEGPEISDTDDLILSRLVNLSFSSITMIDVSNNMTLLLDKVGQKDVGWKELLNRIELLGKGKMLTNVYTLDSEKTEVVLGLLKGTGSFKLPEEVVDALDLPASGFLVGDGVILRVDRSEVNLFMVI